jgi:hypothetical protein
MIGKVERRIGFADVFDRRTRAKRAKANRKCATAKAFLELFDRLVHFVLSAKLPLCGRRPHRDPIVASSTRALPAALSKAFIEPGWATGRDVALRARFTTFLYTSGFGTRSKLRPGTARFHRLHTHL